MGKNAISDQLGINIMHYKRIGYNLNVMRQYAWLVFKQFTVYNYAFLFNCAPVVLASDSMTL